MKKQVMRAGIIVIACVTMGGTAFVAAAQPWQPSQRQRPLTKWLPGETKPDPSPPTAPSGDEPAATTPSAGIASILPSLNLFSTTPTLGAASATTSSAPTAGEPAPPRIPPTVSVRSRLEREDRRFHLDEPVHLSIELSYTGEWGDVQPDAPEEPTLNNLSKKGMVQSSRTVPQGGAPTVVVTYHYEFAPAAEGAAAIEPMEIRYRLRGDRDVLHLTTDRFALTILPRGKPWGKIAGWALGAVAAAGALAGAGAAVGRRLRRAREAAKVPPPPSPLEQIQAELDGVRKLFTQGVAKDGYDAMERFVRKALGLRLKSDFRHMTVSELIERLANESLDERVRDRAASILDRCMQVKFAGYVPTVSDQDQVIADCRTFWEEIK